MKLTSLIALLCSMIAVAAGYGESAQDLANRANKHFQQSEYSQALKLVIQATDLKPDFAEAWVFKGMTEVKLGLPEDARKSYEWALKEHKNRFETSSDSPHEALQQIHVLALLGREHEAQQLSNQIREQFPSSQEVKLISVEAIAASEYAIK